MGLEKDGHARAWPFMQLDFTDGTLREEFLGQEIELRYDLLHQTATIHDGRGNLLLSVTAFWFSWYAFFPETEVFEAEQEL